MTIHKKARLTSVQRREIADKYNNQNVRICDLCRQYSVTVPTIYKVIRQDRATVHKGADTKNQWKG